AQQVFGADDAKDERLGRAIERRNDKSAAGSDEACRRSEEQRWIGDMLDDLEGEHGIEALARAKVFDRRLAVVDVEARRCGMRARNGQRLARGVDAGD